MQRLLLAGMRTACAAALLFPGASQTAQAVPVFPNGGELAGYPNARPQIAFQTASGGPYQYGKRYLSSLKVERSNTPISSGPAADPTTLPSTAPSAPPAPAGDANAGAKLVQANGCEGCHGAGLKGGGIGPALFGIEHKLSADQIADFIRNPRPPMPNFGFKPNQIDDIVAYLSNLDGGATSSRPVVTFDPTTPTDMATVTVRFPGTPPKNVSVTPIMVMGSTTMPTRATQMVQSSSDLHVFTGRVVFSMGGPWTIHIEYDGTRMDVPLNVGQ